MPIFIKKVGKFDEKLTFCLSFEQARKAGKKSK
jgi:hypothetical protein